jgi:hypothetical protein
MEFIKLLKAGSIISGINWAIYLIHEWVNFAKNNPPEALSEGDPIFLGLIAQSIASLGLIGFGAFYKGGSLNANTEANKVRTKPHLTAPPTSFSKPNENAVLNRTEPTVTPVQNSFAAPAMPASVASPTAPPPFASPPPVTPAKPTAPEKSSPTRTSVPKPSDTNHRLITLILIVIGLIGAAIYYVKQNPSEVAEQTNKPQASADSSSPASAITKPTLVATEPINKRWLGKWVDSNTQIGVTEESLVMTNLETKTEVPFRWLGSEPSENPMEPIFYYGKTVSKANLLSNFEKYTNGIANPSDEQKNQIEQSKKILDDLSDGSYRIIRLKMSWSAGIYRSYLFDKNSIFKLDFESEESLSGITRYKKTN